MKSGWDCWNQGERMKMDPHTAGVIRTSRHIGSDPYTLQCWRGGDRYQKWLVPVDLLLTKWRRARVLRLWTSKMNKVMQPHLSPGLCTHSAPPDLLPFLKLLVLMCLYFHNSNESRHSVKTSTALPRQNITSCPSAVLHGDVTTYNVVGYKILDLDWLWSGSFMSCELVTSIIQSVFPNMLCLNEFSVQSFLVSLEQTHWHWYCSSVSTVLLYDAAHVL